MKFLATDTGDVFVGDGSAWTSLGTITRIDGSIHVQDSKPDNPSKNDIWIDTS